MRIARLAVEITPRAVGIRSLTFDRRLQREHRRPAGRELREGSVGALGFRLDPLQVVWRGIYLALILDRQVLRAIALVGDLEWHIDSLLARRDFQSVRAGLARQRNADNRQPAIVLADYRGASRVDQRCGRQLAAGDFDEGNPARHAAFSGEVVRWGGAGNRGEQGQGQQRPGSIRLGSIHFSSAFGRRRSSSGFVARSTRARTEPFVSRASMICPARTSWAFVMTVPFESVTIA